MPYALQPEFLSDVQQCSRAVYLRIQEAAQCGVHSVLLLPIFGEAGRLSPIGVLEVVQSTRCRSWGNIVHELASTLEVVLTPTRLLGQLITAEAWGASRSWT